MLKKSLMVVTLFAAQMTLAQKPASTPVQPPAKAAVIAKAVDSPIPALTPAEQQTMNDFNQQLNELLQKLAPLQQKRAAFVQALNEEHSGFVWHDAQQQGETSGFVKQ